MGSSVLVGAMSKPDMSVFFIFLFLIPLACSLRRPLEAATQIDQQYLDRDFEDVIDEKMIQYQEIPEEDGLKSRQKQPKWRFRRVAEPHRHHGGYFGHHGHHGHQGHHGHYGHHQGHHSYHRPHFYYGNTGYFGNGG